MVTTNTQAYKARLQEFFPPEDPDSEWLFRLMIIRDDLQFEIDGLILDASAGPQEVWKNTYFLRRISISLTEAMQIFDAHVLKRLKRPTDELSRRLKPIAYATAEKLRRRRPELMNLRHALGGHVDPGHAVNEAGEREEQVTQRVLTALTHWAGEVRLLGPIRESTFRELTHSAILFAWPGAVEADSPTRRFKESRLNFATQFSSRFTTSSRVAKPEDGYNFGILDLKTNELRPLDDQLHR